MAFERSTLACPVPRWLPGGHIQTIYSTLFALHPRITFVRDRLELPDGDFIDLDWCGSSLAMHVPNHPQPTPTLNLSQTAARRWIHAQDCTTLIQAKQTPALILFHGLEGSSRSHYAQAIAQHFHARGWIVVIAHFRGCSGFSNRLARAYHAGDSGDGAAMLAHAFARAPHARWHAAGVSLGGNLLLKLLGEQNPYATQLVRCAAISAPMDLRTCGLTLSNTPMGRYVYSPYFLSTMRKKLRTKAPHFPGQIDLPRLARAKTLYDFDDAYTAPVHGYHNALDYWEKASSLPHLKRIPVPTLILNARNDPFVPVACLPTQNDVSNQVYLIQPAQGGHVGFTTGRAPGNGYWLPQQLAQFFKNP